VDWKGEKKKKKEAGRAGIISRVPCFRGEGGALPFSSVLGFRRALPGRPSAVKIEDISLSVPHLLSGNERRGGKEGEGYTLNPGPTRKKSRPLPYSLPRRWGPIVCLIREGEKFSPPTRQSSSHDPITTGKKKRLDQHWGCSWTDSVLLRPPRRVVTGKKKEERPGFFPPVIPEGPKTTKPPQPANLLQAGKKKKREDGMITVHPGSHCLAGKERKKFLSPTLLPLAVGTNCAKGGGT